jgi:tetratricopeptide (TPR) repeat protein
LERDVLAKPLQLTADRYGWLAATALWTAAFAVACRLGMPDPDAVEGSSLAAAMFGQTRHAFGSQLYETADRYFHRGVPHAEERAISSGFFARVGEAVAPTGHAHLSGASTKEMLPWLWLSLKMDPGNMETHRVAAFWLVQEIGRPDLARQVLKQAAQTSPFSYQVKLDEGRLALREGQPAEAREAFAAALAFWPRRQGVDEELARFERADILMYMALLDEIDGHRAEAEAELEQILALFPERQGVRDRLETLRSGRTPSMPAATMWAEMIRRHSARMAVCHAAEDKDHDHKDGSATHGDAESGADAH